MLYLLSHQLKSHICLLDFENYLTQLFSDGLGSDFDHPLPEFDLIDESRTMDIPIPDGDVIGAALANVLDKVRSTSEGRKRLQSTIYTDKYNRHREQVKDLLVDIVCNDKNLDLPEELTRLVPDSGGNMVPNAFILLGKEKPSPV